MRKSLAATLLAAAVALGLPVSAAAAPTCPNPPRILCGERVVAEPETSTTFLQYDGSVEGIFPVLKAIEALSPRFVQVMTLAASAGRRAVPLVRITDETVPRNDKKQVGISLSVHGLEPAGREGGIRYIEDLARWSATATATTPGTDRILFSGDNGFPITRVLAETEVWIGFLNPDGWAAGDADLDVAGFQGPVGFNRENANNADLNRDYPTLGWLTRAGTRGIALSEPETRGWDTLLTGFPNLTTAADIHGEVTSVNNAFSDLLWPAGVWDPTHQAQELQLARNMIRSVERKFAEEGVVLQQLFGPVGMSPANVATGYDVVGYDDSGFMGDYMTQLRGGEVVEIDVENFLSNLVPNNVWSQPIEQAHVAAVRGNMESIIVEALITGAVAPRLNIGDVAFVDEPDSARVTSMDGTGFALVAGETQDPYDVSRLDYFDVLAVDARRTITPRTADAIAGGADLSAHDSIVLADAEVPPGFTGSLAAYVAALDAFARGGGQLVLTDRAVGLLDDLGVVPSSGLAMKRTNAGHVDFGPRTHPWEDDLFGAPSQTYYEVALGFPPGDGEPVAAPHYGIRPAAWNAAGGTTVGTVGNQDSNADPIVVLGEVARGRGTIAVFGAILPSPIESLVLPSGTIETPHPDGLAPYAVTIAGGQVLANILDYRRGDGVAPPPPAAVVPEVPMPVLLPLVAGLALLGVLVHRRRPAASRRPS